MADENKPIRVYVEMIPQPVQEPIRVYVEMIPQKQEPIFVTVRIIDDK